MTALLQDLNGIERILLSVVFVGIAMMVSRWQHADLEKDLLVATLRSFIQLILIGYALELIFELDSPIFILGVLVFMTAVAGQTTASRVDMTSHPKRIALASIGVGSAITIGFLLLLNVFTFTSQDVVPIGGMVIGNAMTTVSLVMTNLTNDFRRERHVIEARLALGASRREASHSQFRRALRGAMIPIVDTTKTVGLIKLPGAMTGMILAGASPIQAVQLQIIVMYMLVGSATFSGLTAAYMTYREAFTDSHQLNLMLQTPSSG